MKGAAVVEKRPATAGEWDAAWEMCDYATYFHSREWAEIWQSWSGRSSPAPVILRFEDGCGAVIAGSLRRGRLGLGSVAELSPAATFGGWLSADTLAAPHARALVDAVLGLAPRVRWRVNPYDPLASLIEAPVLAEDSTQVVELARDFDAVFRTWDQGQRQKVGQARRAGIDVRMAESEADWRAYYDVYQDSLRRWGERVTSNYPWRLFEVLAQRRSQHIRLFLATLEGRVIAGTLCLYARRHVAYWHGGALEEHIKKRPMNLLLHEAMQHACAGGFHWFDFNPSGGHESVRAFKEGFGVTTRRSPVVGRDAGWVSLLARLRGMR